jgi:mono/diheme cytochrome c family protein
MIRCRHLIRHSGAITGFIGDGTRNLLLRPCAKSRFRVLSALRAASPGMTNKSWGVPVKVLSCVFVALGLTGCERGMHEMYDQPKYKPLTSSPLWPDGNSSRPQVPGTQPYSAGALAGVSSGRMGRVRLVPPAGPVSGVDANGNPLARAGAAASPGQSNPLPITLKLLEHGRQRFDVYCAPCHSRAGDGDGMIARRGFPHPPSYHTAALRNAPDNHFYKVITNGYGVMYSYADRVSPHDRWAIVAYIRALQLSQHAPKSDLSVADLARLTPIRPTATFPRKRGKEKPGGAQSALSPPPLAGEGRGGGKSQ